MDIIIVCSGGCGKTTEGMTMETKPGEFEQVDESGVPKWTCDDCLREKQEITPADVGKVEDILGDIL